MVHANHRAQSAVLTASLCIVLGACRSKSEEQDAAAASASAAAENAPKIQLDTPKIAPPPDVAAPPADAEKFGGGVFAKVLGPGTGTVHPTPSDLVEVKYTGWTRKGETAENTAAPVSFILDKGFPAFVDVIQAMVEGETRRIWAPVARIYGDQLPPKFPTGDLTYDVALMKVVRHQAPPDVPAPPDVKAAPKSAKRTKSGLAYRVLEPGSGKQPAATDTVSVNYTGWTPDGKLFDSTTRKKRPLSFRLDQVIKGWTEGVQLMKVGEKARFWIPGALAYGDNPRPGAPAGPLVFDIELVEIKVP